MLLASLPLRHLCVRVHTQQCGGAKEAKEANEANKTIPAAAGRWQGSVVCRLCVHVREAAEGGSARVRVRGGDVKRGRVARRIGLQPTRHRNVEG